MSELLKTTVFLFETDYRRLQALALARGCTTAALLRAAVAEYAGKHGAKRHARSVGAVHSGRGDLSERAEGLLGRMGRDR